MNINLLTLKPTFAIFQPVSAYCYSCNPDGRLQLPLPVKLGCMALPVFNKTATIEYENSRKNCLQHIANIKEQMIQYRFDKKKQQKENVIVAALKELNRDTEV